MIPLPFWFCLTGALVSILALVPLLIKWAPKIGLLDEPGGRKDHEGHVPLIGGLVVFPVFILFSLLMGDVSPAHFSLYAAIILMLVTGAVDDSKQIRPAIKFGLQFVAAFLIVFPGQAHITQLGNLFGLGDVGLDFISLPFSVISVVLLINAINLMDGLDGLAGGVSFIILGWFLAGCLLAGEAVFSPSIALLMAALVGFLYYNMRRPGRAKALIFMGDAGSLCCGLVIAWYAIHLSSIEGRIIEPMSMAWVLAIPIWDECAQFYRRVKEGRHPFSADRGHLHHHFITAGFNPGQAALIVIGCVFITGAVGILGYYLGIPLPALTILWIICILSHMALSRKVHIYPQIIQKISSKGLHN